MITSNRAISADEVASHYDELDRFYRRLWGDHVHHGLWRSGRETPSEAVEQLIDFVIEPLQLNGESLVCDVGCGYGGTSRYIVDKTGANVSGITLSPVQHAYAENLNQGYGNPRIVLGDWTKNPFDSESFDAVVSIECLAHVIDKRAFFEQIQRVLRPGGRAVIAVWLEGDTNRDWHKQWLLEPICREGRLPSMGNRDEYQELATQAGLHVAQFEDLSSQVRKTWQICSRRVLTHVATRPDAWWFVVRRRSSSWVFLFSVWRIRMAYRTRAMRYGLFVLDKR